MTNGERLIEQLRNDDKECYHDLACPYIPGEPHAFCHNGNDADYHENCIPCIRAWLDREDDTDTDVR